MVLPLSPTFATRSMILAVYVRGLKSATGPSGRAAVGSARKYWLGSPSASESGLAKYQIPIEAGKKTLRK